MRKFLSIILLAVLLLSQVGVACAETVWTDDSINEIIIKQYDANALRDEFLPDLPDSLKNESRAKEPQKQTPPSQATTKQVTPKSTIKTSTPTYTSSGKGAVYVKKGTKFTLRVEQALDDTARVGSTVTFTSLYPETNNYITIPAGTRFYGTIEDAHMPQISSNGGLLVISINRFMYKGRSYPVNAQVVMVGEKRVFLNNIKGKRTYWKSVAKSLKPGQKFYSKSWKLTKKFAGDGLEIILTPITFVGGVAVLAGNTIASPFIALFSKGGRLFIDKGTKFKIKLMEDAKVYL